MTTNNTQFTRKDVESYIDALSRMGMIGKKPMQAICALLTDMDAALEALELSKQTEVRFADDKDHRAVLRGFKRKREAALKQCAKWATV